MDKRLKIGLFIDVFFPMVDGVINTVDNYATILSEQHDVVVVTVKHGKKDEEVQRPYQIIRCNRHLHIPFSDYNLPLPSFDFKFKRALKEFHFDIIHIHSPFTIGSLGVKYAEALNIPVFATFHSQFKQDFMSRSRSKLFTAFMMRSIVKTLNKVDLAFGVNGNIEKVYKNEYGVTCPSIVRHNGTDLVLLEDESVIDNIRQEHSLGKEKIFLFVGRIDKVKNIYFIIDSLKEYKKIDSNFKLFIVGNGPDKKQLKKYIKKHNLTSHVIFTGKITDRTKLSAYYHIADLFLFPSLYDSSSLVQIEAASQKTPTVFLEGAVTIGSIKDNVTGFISKQTPADFSNRIHEIFENTILFEEVRNNVYDSVYVTWRNQVDKTLSNYNQALEQKKVI